MGSKRTIDRVAESGRTLRFGLLLAFAVLVLARLPNVILEGRFFGEEGSNFFAYAWHMPWQDALLHPLGGYLNIVASASTLLAKVLVTSGWLSLEKAPYVTILLALFFQCCPAWLILSANDSWLKPWWAKPVALLMLATPPMVEEVWLQSLHSQFHLAVCVAIIIACRMPHFARRHLVNTCKRISYSYFLRDFSIASLELVAGVLMLGFGLLFGSFTWIANLQAGVATPTGTIMLAALPVLMGLQFLLAFIGYDIANAPAHPIGPLIARAARRRKAN